jgi:hypothetical protein
MVRPPGWVLQISDVKVRNLVEQEYYINPVRAKKYADCGSVEGILGLRKKMWEQESRNNWESTLRLWREI